MIQTADIPARQPRLLIVDDERRNRDLLEVMLTPEGFDVTTVCSGEQALAMVAVDAPDLILLDIMMPGKDGFRVVEELKVNDATRNIPIIMISALDTRDSKMRALNSGTEEVLTKPVDRAELCVRVRNLLRTKAYGEHHDRQSQRLEAEAIERIAELAQRTLALEARTLELHDQAGIIDLVSDAITVREMDGRILFWSRGAEIAYGWSSEEAVGKIVFELVKAEFAEPLSDIYLKLLRDDSWEGEVVHYRRDGIRMIVATRWTLQRDGSGAPYRVLAINNDITARRKAESEQVLVSQRLALATSVARVGVWEWDRASDTFAWDATMYDIHGMSGDGSVPYDVWAAAINPDERAGVEASFRHALATREDAFGEYGIRLPDGSVRTVTVCERIVLNDQGEVCGMIGVNMDITVRKQAEQALKESRDEQLRFKDEFISHVSHELRSPLTAIKQFSTILANGLAGDLNEDQLQYQQIVLKNVNQLQSMIDDLLEVTRLETGKLNVNPTRASVFEAASYSVDTAFPSARAKGIFMECEVPEDMPSAYADPIRVRQILNVLLDNAVKFSSAGDLITVTATVAEEGPPFLTVAVTDTGSGMTPEVSSRIFERLYQESGFSQDSRKGLGLGLYICKELVVRQSGQIWVTSEAGKGTTISFTLPVFYCGSRRRENLELTSEDYVS